MISLCKTTSIKNILRCKCNNMIEQNSNHCSLISLGKNIFQDIIVSIVHGRCFAHKALTSGSSKISMSLCFDFSSASSISIHLMRKVNQLIAKKFLIALVYLSDNSFTTLIFNYFLISLNQPNNAIFLFPKKMSKPANLQHTRNLLLLAMEIYENSVVAWKIFW